MDLLDSDLFVLDLRFRDDPRYPANKAFLEIRGAPRATTIYNLLEVCGILSFNLTHAALLALYAEFSRRYALSVLFPAVADHQSLPTMIRGIFDKITRKMTLGDAQILYIAEQHPEVQRIISWNTKDFIGRTSLRVVTPQEWIAETTP
ncbi:MAG: hypothetical protein HYW07_04840 [Candidatus Latescibacteria bacterium]|nr:hypothetical protein [Candidatus Latescibacterota bacterium]